MKRRPVTDLIRPLRIYDLLNASGAVFTCTMVCSVCSQSGASTATSAENQHAPLDAASPLFEWRIEDMYEERVYCPACRPKREAEIQSYKSWEKTYKAVVGRHARRLAGVGVVGLTLTLDESVIRWLRAHPDPDKDDPKEESEVLFDICRAVRDAREEAARRAELSFQKTRKTRKGRRTPDQRSGDLTLLDTLTRDGEVTLTTATMAEGRRLVGLRLAYWDRGMIPPIGGRVDPAHPCVIRLAPPGPPEPADVPPPPQEV